MPGDNGYDFCYYENDPIDEDGHGTHVAGIIAADTGNGKGIAGIASGKGENENNVKIMALKFLDEDGEGNTEDAIAAYEYIDKALDLGVNVVAINNSWGGEGDSRIFEELVNRVGQKGAVSVAAAGNEESDNDKYPVVPASVDSPYMISVAASTEKGKLATFSNYGKETVDLSAPGIDILSSVSYNNFNPLLVDDPATICKDYYNFDNGAGGTPANLNDWKTFSSEDDPVAGAAKIGLSKSGDEHFGKGGSTNGAAMKVSITGAVAGGNYFAVLPYTSEATKKPTIFRSDIKFTKAPYTRDEFGSSEEDDEYNYAEVAVLETEVDGTSKEPVININPEYEKGGFEPYLDYWENPNNTFYHYYFIAENYWESANGQTAASLAGGKDRGIVVFLHAEKSGDYEFYLDNLSRSVTNLDKKTLPKYDFMSGTSMAAPMVTGALALANGQSEAELKGIALVSTVRGANKKVADLNETETEGLLDLDKFSDLSPNLTGAKYIEKEGTKVVNKIELSGKFLGATQETSILKASYKVAGSSETVIIPGGKITWTDEKLTIPMAITAKPEGQSAEKAINFLNKKVKFTVEAGTKKGSVTSYMIKGKQAFPIVKSGYEDYEGETLLSNGKNLFLLDTEGTIWKYYSEDEEFDIVSEINLSKIFGAAANSPIADYFFETDVIYANGRFYGMLVLERGKTKDYALVSSPLSPIRYGKSAEWKLEYKLSGKETISKLEAYSLANYNGKIYFVGGMDIKTGEPSTSFAYYDPAGTDIKNKIVSAEAMPEKRFMARALQSNGKLVVMYGGEKDEELSYCPKTMIYDEALASGLKWKTVKAPGDIMSGSNYYYENDNAYLPFVDGSISLVKNGIIAVGTQVDGLGDTFIYNSNTEEYSPLPYQRNSVIDGTAYTNASVGSSLFSAVKENEFSDEDFDFDFNFDLMDFLNSIDEDMGVEIRRIPITSGLVKIVSGMSGAGSISGAGSFMPGEAVTVQPAAKTGYYPVSFTINGKSDGTFKRTVTPVVDTKAYASFAKMGVSKITSGKRAAGKPVLSWSKAKGAEQYQVLRSTTSKGKYKVIATVSTTTYTDKTATSKKLYYKVCPVNTKGITSLGTPSASKKI
ncbi:MAG: S8 family serine peptidase [Anaerovoracaceae bacterium]